MEQKQNLVSQRAAFDLNCGESIQITKLGNRVYGATGCGKRAAYILECRDTNIESWHRDSEFRQQARVEIVYATSFSSRYASRRPPRVFEAAAPPN